jgi:hypothetical protein
MLLQLCLVFAVLAGGGLAKPVNEHESISILAKEYAALHPNTETEINEEYGEYYDGDILLRDDEDSVENNPLNAVTNPNLLWPSATAYYVIQSGVYTANEVQRIEAGIADLQRLTMVNGQNCIRILPRSNQGDYISVENYSGCSSYVGRVGGRQRLSLVPGCITRHGTIMHEFLHAFGFYHEQSRTDRDDWVTINWDNIQPGTENNFAKLPASQIDPLGTAYDYGSVMHYGAYGFAVDPTIPTIIPHDPDAEIGQRETLSRLDIERVQILYGCLSAEDSVYFRHLDRETLMKYYNLH